MGRSKKWRKTIAGVALGGLLATGVVGSVVAGKYVDELERGLPSTKRLTEYRPPQTSRIYSKDGKLIGTLFRENRTWVPLEKMSPYLRSALISVEDSRFYEHNGVDYTGVARAAWANFTGGEVQQGASTITMQLARNLFLTPERSLSRKAREALLAMQIERQLKKDKILELYLNEVYFGAGAYGVGAASQLYFGKNPSQLNLAEAAMLAGLPQAPEKLSPLLDIKAAKQREGEVLDRMLAVGAITESQYALAHAQTQNLKVRQTKALGGNSSLLKYPYFTSYVIKQLAMRYDDRTLYEGGLNIYTTLDVKSQRQAEATVKRLMAENGPGYNANTAALVAIENKTGYIRAMVGGRGWTAKNQFNRAWQAERQAGSTFKMFVYATALEHGYTPNDKVSDQPVELPVAGGAPWKPQNSDGRFMGDMPLWQALMLSRNVISARLVADLGPQKVLRTAQNLGVAQDAEPHLSLALGAVEVTPLQMASAASALPNDGVRMHPSAVTLITDSTGAVVEDNRQPTGQLAVSPTTARLMTGMLEQVVRRGTGTAAQLSDRPVAGKTGTTDNFRDAWFVGFTPEWTTAVWVGNDKQQTSMWGCFGGSLPAWIWHDFMASSLPPATAAYFPTVANTQPVMVRLCSKTHMKAGSRCKHSYAVRFDPAATPKLCKGEEVIDKSTLAVGISGGGTEAPVVRKVVDGVPTYSNTEPVSLASDAAEESPVEETVLVVDEDAPEDAAEPLAEGTPTPATEQSELLEPAER